MAELEESRTESTEVEGQTKKERESTEAMKPWEQHSRVISMPRFDYKAPSSLLRRSHSGFLITCNIKREKSATKEVISILDKFVGSYDSGKSEDLINCSANGDSKKRKTCTDETIWTNADGAENKGTKDVTDDSLPQSKTETKADGDCVMSLVKLTRSGLLLLTFPTEKSPDTVNIVENVFQSLSSGSLKSPIWCHRIFPIQATCILEERELGATVSMLVHRFLNDKQNSLSRPVKFAVAYNSRGHDETQAKAPKEAEKESGQPSLLDRERCFRVAAAAVKEAVPDSAVDLKSPDLSVLVEMLPVVGIPNESLLVAVSVLSKNLVSTKPRLCIKALVSDKNAKNGKS